GRHLALGAGLVLAVGEDGEADATVGERPVEMGGAALARGGIVGVGMMRGLGVVHAIEPGRRHVVAARRLSGLAALALLSPEVGLVDVVIVGNGNAGTVLGQLAPGPTVGVPLAQVVEHGLVQGFALHAVAGGGFVKLIPGERDEV